MHKLPTQKVKTFYTMPRRTLFERERKKPYRILASRWTRLFLRAWQWPDGPAPQHVHFTPARLRYYRHFPCRVIFSLNIKFIHRAGLSVLPAAYHRIKRAQVRNRKHKEL